MKRYILLALAIVIAHLSIAQRSNVAFGIKGGINAANFKFEPSHSTNARISLHLGLLAHIHVSEHFAVQPEIMVSGQGAEYNDDREDKFTYLNVPILAQVMFGKGFRLQTGPQLGLLMNAKSENGNVEVDVDDNFNRGDFSWAFGGGYLFPSGVGIDARYNLGISDVSEANGEINNRVWQFGVFYQFKKH